MTDVVVIGAGVIGASVVFRLAQAGARVTVVEAGREAGGTSSATFSWINANAKTPRAYHDLNVAGMRAHAALRDELGAAPWLHGGGNVEWLLSEEGRAAQRAKVERLRAWGYAAEWIGPRDLAELEPDVELGAIADAQIAFYPDEGWLDPVPYAHAMLTASRRHGAAVRLGERVEAIDHVGGRVRGVVTASGKRLPADIVADCAGPQADAVAALAGLRLPLAPTLGLLAITGPVAAHLERVVNGPPCQLRPDGGGRVMLHADAIDAEITPGSQPADWLPLAQALARRAATVLPVLAGAKLDSVRVGTRPIPADGLSAVGFLPGAEGFYVVVTHSGVTLAPFLARAVAEELAGGKLDPRLEAFRPARLQRLSAPS
jgi:glycine/D-amino acid oxidase-like deaminating enzyme